MGEKFDLRWNDFEKNIVSAYKGLRSDQDFFDCSLICSGQTFKAHRVIISACSPVFRQMIRDCDHHHPVLYMRGVKPEDMAALLDFMYHGQAGVAEADLERFLEVAEDLTVRGLTMSDEEDANKHVSGQETRVSGGDLDTAVDDDVNDLLAGLDDQPPPSKRVKQERQEAQLGFSIRTSGGAAADTAVAAVQEKIRIKQEQRDSESRLASLSNSISLQKVAEPPTPVSVSPANYTPPPGITMTRPGAPGGSSSHTTPVTPSLPLQSAIQTSIQSARSVAISASTPTRPSPVVRPSSSPMVRPIHSPQVLAGASGHVQRPAASSAVPSQMSPVPGLSAVRPGSIAGVQNVRPGMAPMMRPGLGPMSPMSGAQVRPGTSGHNPAMVRLQVEHNKDGSPPVLHLPEGFSNNLPVGPIPPGVVNQAAQQHHHQQVQQQQMQQQQQQQLQQLQLQQQLAQLGSNPEDYQKQIEAMIEKAATGSKLSCKECKKSFNAKSKASLIAHIESVHLKADISCNKCEKKFKATSYLKQHQKRGPCAVAS